MSEAKLIPPTERELASYALAKQIPELKEGFVIPTNYGDIEVNGKDAELVHSIIEKLFISKLAGERP